MILETEHLQIWVMKQLHIYTGFSASRSPAAKVLRGIHEPPASSIILKLSACAAVSMHSQKVLELNQDELITNRWRWGLSNGE